MNLLRQSRSCHTLVTSIVYILYPACLLQVLDEPYIALAQERGQPIIEAIRRDLRDQKLDRTDPVRWVDSAPVTLMTFSRGARCKSVVGSQFSGVVTSKKGKVFGLRLHTTVTVNHARFS